MKGYKRYAKNFIHLPRQHTKNTSYILSTVSAKLSYATRLSTHGGNGANGGKGKYPLNTSQKKNFTHSVHQMNVSQTPMRNTVSRDAVRQLFSQKTVAYLCPVPVPLWQ